MAFKESVNNNVVRIATILGENLGSVAGYISTHTLHERAKAKIRFAVSNTVDRVGGVINKIDAKSSEIVDNVSSELKHLPKKAAHTIGNFTKQADQRFNMTVQNGTYYLIDFAGMIKASLAEGKILRF